jgi:hypothetical protein
MMDTNVLLLALAVILVVFRVVDPIVVRILGRDK